MGFLSADLNSPASLTGALLVGAAVLFDPSRGLAEPVEDSISIERTMICENNRYVINTLIDVSTFEERLTNVRTADTFMIGRSDLAKSVAWLEPMFLFEEVGISCAGSRFALHFRGLSRAEGTDESAPNVSEWRILLFEDDNLMGTEVSPAPTQ